MKKVLLASDGGSRGNPGHAAIGAVVTSPQGEVLASVSEYIGITTNNSAEYQALYAGLLACEKLCATEVACFLDSELLVKQMTGEYRVKDPGLASWNLKVCNISKRFHRITFTHVRREQNAHADRLVNEALDRAMKKLAEK